MSSVVQVLDGRYLLIKIPQTGEELLEACQHYDCTVNGLPIKLGREIEEILLRQVYSYREGAQ